MASTTWGVGANGTRVASGNTVFNQNSAFFTGTIQGQPFPGTVVQPISSMYGLSLDQVRDLAVLHELFHVTDVMGLFNDATGHARTDEMYSKAINEIIRRDCGFPK